MKRVLLWGVVLVLCAANPSFSQSYEKNLYWDQPSYSYCYNAEELPNEHALITLTQTQGDRGSSLIELNANGDTIWEKSYYSFIFKQVRVRPDGKIVVASSKSYSNDCITVFDSVGQMLQHQAYRSNTSVSVNFRDIYVAPDNSIFFSGSYRDIYSGGSVTYYWELPLVGRIKSDLTLDWVRTYGVHNSSNRDDGVAYRIKPSGDGNFIVFGTRNRDSGVGYIYVGKISPTGTGIWNIERNDPYSIPAGLAVSNSGSIYTARYENNSKFGSHDIIVEKLKANGDTVWCKVFGTSDSETVNEMKIDNAGNLVIVGGMTVSSEYDPLLIKLDTNGTILQNISHSNAGTVDRWYDVEVTGKNQYLLSGQKRGVGAMMMKTDMNGLTGCSVDTVAMQSQPYPSLMTTGVNFGSVGVQTVSPYPMSIRYFGLNDSTRCFAPAPCSVIAGMSVSNSNPCAGEKVTLTVASTGQTADQWYVNGGAVAHGNTWDSTFTSAGTIQVKLISSNGACIDSSVITIQVKPSYQSSKAATICKGTGYNFHGNTLIATGIYVDTLSAVNFCDSVVTLNLTVSNPDTAVSLSGNVFTASTNTTYQWVDCATGQPIPGANSSTYTATANGSYRVVVTDSIGCQDSSGCRVIQGIGIETDQHQEMRIGPNPFRDYLIVKGHVRGEAVLTIVDGQGRKVWSERVVNGTFRINTSQWAPGIYSGTVLGQNKTTFKMVKME